jgi:hypothetical protein
MIEFEHEPIYNQENNGSSAFIFDLRNSTKIIRKISWDKRIEEHIKFMWDLHQFLYKKIADLPFSNKIALNDTGDGYLCVFWDDKHAITCMKIAMELHAFFEDKLPKHNEKIHDEEDVIPKFDYGFGFHTGGSTIYRTIINWDHEKIRKDFIYGIVVNSVARLESITKNYIEYKFLLTGNYNQTLKQQLKDYKLSAIIKNKISDFVFLGRININDGKTDGHKIYGINQETLDYYKSNFS